MEENLRTFLRAGWLLPLAAALAFFSRWIVDIVIPTLKGGNFDALYDLHGVQYLDITLILTIIGFIWMSVVVIRWVTNSDVGRKLG